MEKGLTMENIVTIAVDQFRVKLTDAIYDNMVEECFIDADDESRDKIADLIMIEAKYHADKRRLIFTTRDYKMSVITRILEHISVDLHKYIKNIYFCAKPTDKYIVFDMQVDIELEIPNLIELYYFEKAKAKIDK